MNYSYSYDTLYIASDIRALLPSASISDPIYA